MRKHFIECVNVSHTFNQGQANAYIALKNISLTVETGEHVAILGTNGSGKSTLAKHFNALLLPTEGKCFIDGVDIASSEETLWESRQKIGMVFQNPDNQIIGAIVEDDVAFGPENIGMPPEEIKIQVEKALKAVDMLEYRKSSPHRLSGGQKQRIAIAGALAMNTRCLVLDEPTAMLDPRGRHEVMDVVTRLNKEQGMTVVNITHYMDEAAMADRVLVLEKGSLMQEGTPQEIFADIDKMKKLGLAVPVATEMAYRLHQRGIKLPASIINTEDLVRALCQ